MREQDLQLGLEVVIIGGHVFLKPPLLRFEPLTAAQAADIPDLARLFDPVNGLPAIIPLGRNPKYLGVETIDNVDSHRVEATYTADQVKGMLSQLSSQGDVDAVIWVGGSDHYIRKAVLTGKFGRQRQRGDCRGRPQRLQRVGDDRVPRPHRVVVPGALNRLGCAPSSVALRSRRHGENGLWGRESPAGEGGPSEGAGHFAAPR